MADDEALGKPRVGWLLVESLPHEDDRVPCMLVDDGARIQLRVPLERIGTGDPVSRWFFSPYEAKPSSNGRIDTAPPSAVGFVDSNGIVILAGCRWSLQRISPYGTEGVIVAEHAIVGANSFGYPHISGMRTEISGLNDWFGHVGLTQRITRADSGRAESIAIEARRPEPRRLVRAMNLSADSTWRVANALDGVTIEAPVELTTSVNRARLWEDHFGLHHAVLQLVEIANWSALGFRSMKVSRVDDPEQALDGTAIGAGWHPVLSRGSLFSTAEPSGRRDFLFRFDDIGTAGLKRWLALREDFQRGVLQMHAQLRQPGMFLEVQQMNAGGALEAIGYVLAVQAGKSQKDARNEAYENRLERIRSEIPESVLDSSWPARSRAAFMSAKHVDALEPSREDQIRALGENLLAFRYWLGKRLGATDRAMRRLIRLDPVVRRFRLEIRD